MPTGATGELVAGRYRLVRELGHGGMGTVYLARDERLGRLVALKRMHPTAPDEISRRFEREARVGAALDHPNIVRVYDVASDVDGGTAIAMEYVEGETLADVLARTRLDPAAAVRVVRRVADALDHAHSRGVVHRDVKPANILLHPGGVKLADLGISRQADQTRITVAGSLLGTAAYMAPEQLAGEDVGPAADVHALGLVAYEALTGTGAREGLHVMEILQRADALPPPDLRQHWPQAPAAAAAAIQRALARDPRDRPSSAGELASELERALRTAADGRPDATAATRVLPAPPRPRRRLPVAALLALVLLAGATGVAAALALTAGEDDRDAGGTDGSVPAAAPDTEPATTAPTTETPPATGAGTAPATGAEEQPATTAELPATTAEAPPTTQEPPPSSEAPSQADAEAAASTVASFYGLAADGAYDAALALLDDGARRQFRGNRMRGTFGELEQIEFHRLEPRVDGDRAEVALATTAVHRTHVDECQGGVSLSRGDRAWLISGFAVACDSAARGDAGDGREPGVRDGRGDGDRDRNGNGNGNGRGRDGGGG